MLRHLCPSELHENRTAMGRRGERSTDSCKRSYENQSEDTTKRTVGRVPLTILEVTWRGDTTVFPNSSLNTKSDAGSWGGDRGSGGGGGHSTQQRRNVWHNSHQGHTARERVTSDTLYHPSCTISQKYKKISMGVQAQGMPLARNGFPLRPYAVLCRHELHGPWRALGRASSFSHCTM